MKNFCEFFAGVGLVRQGLKTSGWNCIFANDISLDKKDTYVKNFGGNHFLCEDIWNLAKNPEAIPNNSHLYTASFPCTDLSLAGARAGLKGKESGTISALINIISEKKKILCAPKVVLLENVQGFLTSHNGDDVIDTVKKFSDLGYYVDIIEIDAIKFSAQSRPRVFFIAVEETLAKENMILKSSFSLEDKNGWQRFFGKSQSFRSKKLESIIERSLELNWGFFDLIEPKEANQRLINIVEKDIPENSKRWWDESRRIHLLHQMSNSHRDNLEKMVKSKNISYATVYRRTRNGIPMAELRTDGYAGCLRTPRGGSSKQILITAGNGTWKVRLLTPREYARLQGVSDSFILPESDNKGYFAMGDAVCVPVIEYIAKNILRKLFKESQFDLNFN